MQRLGEKDEVVATVAAVRGKKLAPTKIVKQITTQESFETSVDDEEELAIIILTTMLIIILTTMLIIILTTMLIII